jgi:RNA polymerase sigma-70 factor (ECF subfamily)
LTRAELLAESRSALVLAAYDAHQRDLFSFLLATTRDRQVAEDLHQETFLRLVREMRAGRSPDDPRRWLFRVAANLAASRGRRLTVAVRALGRVRPPDDTTSPEAGYLEQEQNRALDAALGTLSLDARRALLLAAHGFSGPEIAEIIGRTPLATRSLMWRARLQLREQLEASGGPR